MTMLQPTTRKPNGASGTLDLANQFVYDVRTRVLAGETVSDRVENGLRAAKRTARHGIHAAEDLMSEAAVRVRRRPLQAVSLAATSGALAGAAAMWSWVRLRRR